MNDEPFEPLDLSLDALIEFMEQEIDDDMLDPYGVNGYRTAYQEAIIEQLARLKDLEH